MNRIDMNKARDLTGIGANEHMDALVKSTVAAAFNAREVIIEAAFRKEFGNPEEMSHEQRADAASQCNMECQLVDGVNHFRFQRMEVSGPRLLVEVVQTVDGDTLNTSFRSEIGDLGLGDE